MEPGLPLTFHSPAYRMVRTASPAQPSPAMELGSPFTPHSSTSHIAREPKDARLRSARVFPGRSRGQHPVQQCTSLQKSPHHPFARPARSHCSLFLETCPCLTATPPQTSRSLLGNIACLQARRSARPVGVRRHCGGSQPRRTGRAGRNGAEATRLQTRRCAAPFLYARCGAVHQLVEKSAVSWTSAMRVDGAVLCSALLGIADGQGVVRQSFGGGPQSPGYALFRPVAQGSDGTGSLLQRAIRFRLRPP